ncbi:MAG TPA: VWA domain-containing protein [Acidobacteriaceae bacterium]|nr:VWA domain-containing protein [Acidobacteriaceae bacterium]
MRLHSWTQVEYISLLLISVVLCGTPIFAQEQAPSATSTISVNVKVVALDALVRNPDGQLVLDLGKDAFTLKVDGKPTAVRYFNRDNDLPLTIGLMIDTSGSQRVYFDEEALNSETFLNNILTNPKDRALIACFDSRIDLLQKMTTRLNELHNALRRLDYLAPETGPGATRLYDSIAALSKSVTSPEAGRRALVILTDGDDNGSQTSLQDAIREAQLAGVAVYGVLYTHDVIGGVPYPSAASLRPSGIAVMKQISKATGGRAFVVGTGTPIAEIFAEIGQDLRSQYRFGFTPLPSKPGKFHSIELRTGDKHQTIQARSGYITPE